MDSYNVVTMGFKVIYILELGCAIIFKLGNKALAFGNRLNGHAEFSEFSFGFS